MVNVPPEDYIIELSPKQSISSLRSRQDDFPKDCLLLCQGRRFHINRHLLSEKNSYFKLLFSSAMKESVADEVELHEVDAVALEAILNFLQTDTQPSIKGDISFVTNLISASHMLLVKDLFNLCCEQLKDLLSEKNFKQFWKVSKFYDEDNLLDVVLEFAANHFLELKEYILEELNFKELKIILKHANADDFPSNSLLEFVFLWINLNLTQRLGYLNECLSLTNMNSLSEDYLSHVLNHEEVISSSQVATDILLETYTLHHLKIFIFSRISFQIYFVRAKNWSHVYELPVLPNEFLRKGLFIRNNLYILTGLNFVPTDIISVYKFNLRDSSLVKLLDLNLEGHLYITVMNNKIFFLNNTFLEYTTEFLENKISIYDPSTNQCTELMRNFNPHVVYYITCVQNSILTYEEGIGEIDRPMKRYDLTNSQWHGMSYPDPSPYNHEDIPTTCLDEFFVLRCGEELMQITWYYHQPMPLEEIEALKSFGYPRMIDYGNRFTCKIISREKTFFRYDFISDTWHKSVTSDGPEEIRYVWQGPTSQYLRVPFIYILGRDWMLYQYNPKMNTWEKLGLIPNNNVFALSLPFWSMGC